MITHMSEPAREPLAYEAPSTHGYEAWRLLRLAVILWASLVLLRHATYWASVLPNASGPAYLVTNFAFLAMLLELPILVAALIVASPRDGSPAATRWLRTLGIAYCVVAAVALLPEMLMLTRSASVRGITRPVWQIVSRVQLLVVPVLCIVYRPHR